jgi:hypothetical protein
VKKGISGSRGGANQTLAASSYLTFNFHLFSVPVHNTTPLLLTRGKIRKENRSPSEQQQKTTSLCHCGTDYGRGNGGPDRKAADSPSAEENLGCNQGKNTHQPKQILKEFKLYKIN